jgi:hypothetical protein
MLLPCTILKTFRKWLSLIHHTEKEIVHEGEMTKAAANVNNKILYCRF